MASTDTTFYVRYAETDTMGVVHHSVYIVWFEEGRSHYLRARGADYAQLEATGYFFALSELEARYIAPAHYGERVTVRTHLESLRSRSISLTYEVLNADSGQLLVTGRTKLICVNREGQVVRIPEAWRQLMSNA
jgi:acyl-CoA thioester hydrolase